ncbi:hypothetical protein ES708_19508 [subsurface metagenome]
MIRICRRCSNSFVALFGDMYCVKEGCSHKDFILEFYGTNPPMRHRVWGCKYFGWKQKDRYDSLGREIKYNWLGKRVFH